MSASSPTDISGIAADGAIATASSRLRLHGFTAEATGGEVHFRLRDGTSDGTVMLTVHLLDGETAGDTMNDGWIVPSNTLWIEFVIGGSGAFLVGSIQTNAQGD